MKIVRDIKALTDMVEDVDSPLTEIQRSSVQRLICENVAREEGSQEELVDQATELMMMLGVHPSQEDTLEEQPISIRRLRTFKT